MADLKSSGVVDGTKFLTANVWAQWDASGTSDNITGSYNVSSVTYQATGRFSVNYDTDFGNDNYAATATCMDAGARHMTFYSTGTYEPDYVHCFITNTTQTATTSQVACFMAMGEH